jgi:hypothetical protein
LDTKPSIDLVGDALGKWVELYPRMVTRHKDRAGVMVPILTAYCAAFGRWKAAEEFLADPAHGPVVTIRDDKGNIKTHGPAPQLTIAERSAREMSRLLDILRF